MKDESTALNNIKSKPWYVIEEGNDTGKVKIPTLNFIEFLGCLHYYYAQVGEHYQIVRIIDNIVTPINDNAEIIEIAVQWLKDNSSGNYIEGISTTSIKSAWLNKTPQLFSPLNLKFLPKIIISPHFDTKDTCYLYFANTAVSITSKGSNLIPYKDLDGHIFSNQIINRNF